MTPREPVTFGWNESIGAMRRFMVDAARRAGDEGRPEDACAILQEIRED